MAPVRMVAASIAAYGILMAVYLGTRPYGDTGNNVEAAQAFASRAWVFAHLCGMFAVAGVAVLAVGLAEASAARSARIARRCGVVAAVLVLPYYGMETFALYAVGARSLADPDLFSLVAAIQNQPVALGLFGVGLLALSGAGVAIALTLARVAPSSSRWAVWWFGVMVATFPVQYFLPPVGRVAFGMTCALVSLLCAVIVRRAYDGDHERIDGQSRL